MALNRSHPAFKETAKPFFDIVMEGLNGEVEGEHFWDAVAEDAVFEFSYKFPTLEQILKGRDAYMDWFANYSNVLTSADNLKVYKDAEENVVILDYQVHGISAAGKKYDNRFCSIVAVKDKKIVHWVDFADTFSAFQAMQPSD